MQGRECHSKPAACSISVTVCGIRTLQYMRHGDMSMQQSSHHQPPTLPLEVSGGRLPFEGKPSRNRFLPHITTIPLDDEKSSNGLTMFLPDRRRIV